MGLTVSDKRCTTWIIFVNVARDFCPPADPLVWIMKSFSDFLAESDSEDSRLEDDRGRGGGLGDLKRPGPSRPMSASTAASEEGMMIGGVKVRMPVQSRPTSASSSSTLKLSKKIPFGSLLIPETWQLGNQTSPKS
eukprot:s729_g2.t1